MKPIKQNTMKNNITDSMISGTMKFHLKAAKAFEQYGKKENAKRAIKAANALKERLSK